jgi:hypothetical protein
MAAKEKEKLSNLNGLLVLQEAAGLLQPLADIEFTHLLL